MTPPSIFKYYHFLAMPDLRVFANAGFPYTRMADLSTLIVVPKTPDAGQVETLLQAVGCIGARAGWRAINLQMTDDGNQIKGRCRPDADWLFAIAERR